MTDKRKRFNEGPPHRNYITEGAWGRQLSSHRQHMLEYITVRVTAAPGHVINVPEWELTVRDGSHDGILEIHPGHIISRSSKDSRHVDQFTHNLDLCTLAAICDYLDFIDKG